MKWYASQRPMNEWIGKTPYYEILLDDQIADGLIVFELMVGNDRLGGLV